MLLVAGWGAVAVRAGEAVVTAVHSIVREGYVREKLPDGSPKLETYVVGNGGYVAGTEPNPPADEVSFPAIVRLMAGPLADRKYLPARDAKSADLLLLISWGRTVPFSDAQERINLDGVFSAMNNLSTSNANVSQLEANGQGQRTSDGIQSPARSVRDANASALEGTLIQMQMFDDMRVNADQRNARLLGYAKEISDRDNPTRFAGNGTTYDDLIADIENERYYVIISAYDYQMAAREKKKMILWTTRVSVQARGNHFRDSLATMLANAAGQFGQNSGRLIRQYHREKIRLGELKLLETLPDMPPPAKPPEEK